MLATAQHTKGYLCADFYCEHVTVHANMEGNETSHCSQVFAGGTMFFEGLSLSSSLTIHKF